MWKKPTVIVHYTQTNHFHFIFHHGMPTMKWLIRFVFAVERGEKSFFCCVYHFSRSFDSLLLWHVESLVDLRWLICSYLCVNSSPTNGFPDKSTANNRSNSNNDNDNNNEYSTLSFELFFCLVGIFLLCKQRKYGSIVVFVHLILWYISSNNCKQPWATTIYSAKMWKICKLKKLAENLKGKI